MFGCTGEEGPADELWESINELKVERIDHGVSCLQDPKLMKLLKQTRMPLTVCPCSNFKVRLWVKAKHVGFYNLNPENPNMEVVSTRCFCSILCIHCQITDQDLLPPLHWYVDTQEQHFRLV